MPHEHKLGDAPIEPRYIEQDDEIHSWNGQRTPTADKLARGTVWVLGFIALMIFAVALTQAAEAALQWWRG